MLCTASCVCSLYGCVVLYVCGGVWMNVYVCFWIKSKTLPILSGQPKEVCCQMKVKGCFWCPSLCCWCVLSHLMLFDVFESDTTVHPPCYVSFYWVGWGGLHKAFWKLFTCCLHRQTHICFMLTSSGGIQRAPVSIMDIRRHPACNISAGHSVTLLSLYYCLQLYEFS